MSIIIIIITTASTVITLTITIALLLLFVLLLSLLLFSILCKDDKKKNAPNERSNGNKIQSNFTEVTCIKVQNNEIVIQTHERLKRTLFIRTKHTQKSNK